MTAAQPEIPVTERIRSMEVRWILPGQLGAAVTGWFARFPTEVESREDSYLVDPRLGGLSVKLRNGRALEVKTYQGSPGILDVTGRARGRLESWDKWSFPHDPLGPDSADGPGWRRVRKLIRRFTAASRQRGAHAWGRGAEPVCKAELTEVRVHDQAWWTLAFEATGPASLLRGKLQAAAALVFAEPLPGGLKLGADNSQSYVQWLTCGQVPSGTGA
jgi:hypothetical protein